MNIVFGKAMMEDLALLGWRYERDSEVEKIDLVAEVALRVSLLLLIWSCRFILFFHAPRMASMIP